MTMTYVCWHQWILRQQTNILTWRAREFLRGVQFYIDRNNAITPQWTITGGQMVIFVSLLIVLFVKKTF